MNTRTTVRSHQPTQTPDIIPVVLIRHAQSAWNQENRFTGWADPPLSETGVSEAVQAARLLQAHGYQFDAAFSSRLQRATHTLHILLEELGQSNLPGQQDWRLNERHYGVLQGLNKADMAARVGAHQVWRWRRGYTDMAEPLQLNDPAHPRHDPLYAGVAPQSLPAVENLAMTRERVAAFWREQVWPRVMRGERVLISSHGNSLRALLMELGDMSVEQVESFEIPTATPIVYPFTTQGRALGWYYLTQEPVSQVADGMNS